jgi:hypothetical protein
MGKRVLAYVRVFTFSIRYTLEDARNRAIIKPSSTGA